MGGRFTFALRDPSQFDKAKFLAALKDAQKIKAPPEVYASFSSAGMGIGLVVKVQHRPEWTLLLPVDPLRDPIECGFTYGIVSRPAVWEYVKKVLSLICAAVPWTFELSYEDHDLGEYVEVGFWDHGKATFVVQHRGLPSAQDMERAAAAAKAPPPLTGHAAWGVAPAAAGRGAGAAGGQGVGGAPSGKSGLFGIRR